MARTPQHTYQFLTKRPERMQSTIYELSYQYRSQGEFHDNSRIDGLPLIWPLPNVWLGVSVENQYWADKRIPLLLQTPAAVRVVSYEPALKRVDFGNWMEAKSGINPNQAPDPTEAKRTLSLSGLALLDWLIMGGESGPKARVCVDGIEEAMRSTLAQCRAAGVPFFAKQMGTAWAKEHGAQDYKGGDISAFPEDLIVREWPKLLELAGVQ